MADGYLRIKTKIDNSDTSAQVNLLKKKLEGLNQTLAKMQNVNGVINGKKLVVNPQKILEVKASIEKLNNQIDKLSTKKAGNNLKKNIDGASNSAQGFIKKLVRMGIAIFGIESAFSAVRNIVSTLNTYNEQMKTNLDYMKYAVATAFQPAIEKIIQSVYYLLGLINSISLKLFKFNLFSKSSVKNFNALNDSAKELKKTTAGFDEMNIVGDTTATSTVTPQEIVNEPIPDWMTWIFDNGELLAGIIVGIATSLTLMKFGMVGIKAVGFGLIIAGVIVLVSGLLDYLKDPSWENFGKIWEGIGLILIGIGVIIGGLPLIIAGVVVLIIGIIMKNWETIKAFFLMVWSWIDDKLKWLENNFGLFGKTIAMLVRGAVGDMLSVFGGLFTGIKQIFDGILAIFRGDFKNGFILIGKGILNVIISIINSFIGTVNLILLPLRSLIMLLGKVTGNNWTMDNIKIPQIPQLATGGVVNRPTNAIIGEAGKEAVVPLENNLEWLDKIASMLSEKMGGGTGGSTNVYLDGRLVQKQNAIRTEILNFATNGGK